MRLGYRINEAVIQNWFVGGRHDKVTNVASGASLAIKQQEGSAVTISLGHSLSYDVRDSRFSTTKGYVVRMDNEFAGLGGDVRFIKNELSGSYYYPVIQDVVASVTGAGGYITGLDSDVRIIDRFFLGGADLRGFDNLGVGPRDVTTSDAVGGNWYYRGSIQVRFPLGLPNELGFQGRAFTDLGSLGGTDGGAGVVTDTGSLRAAVGVGIGWNSPFGPLSVDVSKALLKESFDEDQTVRFSFGTRF